MKLTNLQPFHHPLVSILHLIPLVLSLFKHAFPSKIYIGLIKYQSYHRESGVAAVR